LIRRYPRLCVFAYENFVFLRRVTDPSAKSPFLEDQFVSLSLASLLRPVRLGRPYQEHKERTAKEWRTPNARNTPSITNLEEEEIVDAPGNDGNASMPVQVKRPNPWRKMMMMMMMMMIAKVQMWLYASPSLQDKSYCNLKFYKEYKYGLKIV